MVSAYYKIVVPKGYTETQTRSGELFIKTPNWVTRDMLCECLELNVTTVTEREFLKVKNEHEQLTLF